MEPTSNPSDMKTQVIREVRSQHAMNNAKELVDKINFNCFEQCIPKPGDSLSSSEQNCLGKCAEKYMAAWNVVSGEFLKKIQEQ
ncbi:Tim10/DDP family zinc finger-domain-containing protein [Nemania sp. FL0916]|nr:Tim10/DDP family zinc finger-domain-containing protein [Nemania sp. FL0916]